MTSSLYKPATSDDAQNASVEEWINISATKFATESTFNMPHEAGDSSLNNGNRTNISKKSLVNRLDTIAKGKVIIHLSVYFEFSLKRQSWMVAQSQLIQFLLFQERRLRITYLE